ncbi:tryptophanase [Opitutaceae bacterium TAV4]|nr:tryptophanase [Opitutaceae bacterium TAV4]RRJ98842.1 tryptophanase [Opitutaceae bacterium TAV3]
MTTPIPSVNGSSGSVKFFSGENIPLEMHKVRVVQKLNLVPVERRLAAIQEAGFNSFLLSTKDVYLDMLTDSGTNAMSDNQTAAMFQADDAYAGSQSFVRLNQAVEDVFGKKYLLPVHQGRAAENILSQTFVKPGTIVPMNYHFTTTHAHIHLNGGTIEELVADDALEIASAKPFKGDLDPAKLRKSIAKHGADKIAFVRMEASTNLIGGQPFSIANMREIRAIADQHKLMLVLDASLIGENAYWIKRREAEFKDATIATILRALCDLADIVYFSARKVTSSRGGGICTNRRDLFEKMKHLVPLYEGFLTYGGISVREIESMAVGLRETTDETVISQSPAFIEHLVGRLQKQGVPVVTPAGGLGCHVDAGGFLPHLDQRHYPAASLVAAFYIASGVRGMERGTMSSVRDENGNDVLADAELMRLAMPRRVFTLSQIRYVEDRLAWLYANRNLIGGTQFIEEPPVLRFFMGRLGAIGDWPEKLMAKFRADFGDSL